MNMDDNEILEELISTRNLAEGTKNTYKATFKLYTKLTNKSLQELLEEAEQEEEARIRWKKRTLKKRLIEYRKYLYENMLRSSAKSYFRRILTFYKHFEIEIHELPQLSTKKAKKAKVITFKDLPDKEIIKRALKISGPLMQAVILFMSSSGCAKAETLNLKISDFIDATKEYHLKENIYDALNILKDHEDIIPLFSVYRIKTDKNYHTCCSPEAVVSIVNYLLTRDEYINPEDNLFDISADNLDKKFKIINETLGLGKKGTYNRFRSHNLRKYHASQLYNNGMSKEIVDALQGRSKDSTMQSYFFESPEKLRETYIQHLSSITINLDVNTLDLKSPEYVQLESELENKEMEVAELKQTYELTIEDILKRVDSLEQKEINSNTLMKYKQKES